jgi:hypothetical protein
VRALLPLPARTRAEEKRDGTWYGGGGGGGGGGFVGLRCGGCASADGGSVRVREAIGDFIVVGGRSAGWGPAAPACARLRGEGGKGRTGTGRRGCRVGPPSVSVTAPGSGGHPCLAGCDSPSDPTCEPPFRLNRGMRSSLLSQTQTKLLLQRCFFLVCLFLSDCLGARVTKKIEGAKIYHYLILNNEGF